ncbi:MAG TPA: acyltransferase family protein, partial [Puia sp.]|nr:acyltransferase family protein [Puia sp.]
GLLLFRTGKLIRVPMAYAVCSLLMIALFFMPTGRYSGIYEALCVIFAFPVLVAMGAGGEVSGWLGKLCKFSGEISYPIYITHYPFIYIYTAWVSEKKPTPAQILPVACGLFVFFILLAWAAYKFYDVPVRAWLKKKWLQKI